MSRYPEPGGLFPAPACNVGWLRSHVACLHNFLSAIGGKATKVPYKSMGDSVPDLDGQLDFVVADGTFAIGQARAGRMKMLASTLLERVVVSPRYHRRHPRQ